ncbi:MAG: acetyl/propionyl/methylcrotonyl-CoA carboxylase subunit alpha [Burkholderiaceae bacterium]
MFRKILIANRGEIACRVIRSAHALGVATVAVYSDADAQALHVRMADEAIRIGPAPAAQSYLNIAAIIDAAQRTGAEAIHPGYGFLSENPRFVEAVVAAGLVFIGPSADAIRAMGLKDEAKRRMQAAGVPVVPGYHGAEQDPQVLKAEAEKIGYPVLIKARAGGGGKGMRRVDDPSQFESALAGAQREAQSSFGDSACLIEKYVSSPRHIEVQVFGDGHGNVVHLFERDCSLQRRHQKVIEEAPAPGMPPEMRAAMGEAAVRAAKAIDYVGAGTIEFIADGSDGLRPDRFWFMEMNTRLQVEHPVTECITGQDLVAWQLRVASGEPLPSGQEQLRIDGWAFEARLYAENVDKGFLPATGLLARLRLPADVARVDSGVEQGDRITPHYDPMIAKIIVHGPTREAALNRLALALARAEVSGTVTNLAFLGALCRHAGFARGEVDTGLIERDLAQLTAHKAISDVLRAVAGLVAAGHHRARDGSSGGPGAAVTDALGATSDGGPWASRSGWRLWSSDRQMVSFVEGDAMMSALVEVVGTDRHIVTLGEVITPLSILARDGNELRIAAADAQYRIRVADHGDRFELLLGQGRHAFARFDPLSGDDDDVAGGDSVASPMTGLVKVVDVAVGDTVRQGQRLIVLEAMKMEHSLTAPRDGEVAEVTVAAGTQVDEGSLLVALKPPVAG